MSWRSLAAFLVVLATIAGGFYLVAEGFKEDLRQASFGQALKQRDASVAGCFRSRADRQDAIRGWKQAQEARTATANNPNVDDRERLEAAAAAAVYGEVIHGYRSRLVECEKAFPPVAP